MNSRTCAGFALVKFSMTLIMLGGIALGTAPMYYKFINNFRATDFTNGLVKSLQLARNKAIALGSAVSVCASDNGNSCTDTPWSRGYIVFADSSTPGIVDGNDGVIEITRSRTPHVNVKLTGGQYVRFLPNGGLLAQGPSANSGVMVATNEASSWLQRLSPIAAATASDELFQHNMMDMGDTQTQAVKNGAFTVCVGPSGRAINISYMGRITTSRIPCE